MKKIYLTLAALTTYVALNAQSFFTNTSYRGAFPVTDNTPATDWTSGWANFDPENTSYGAPTTTVSADITANTTWSGIVLLKNKVYVKSGAVLTIQPGTIVRGDKTTQATLIITRGSKIMATGTSASPIIFTSSEAAGQRAEGDWGGLVVLGAAKNNQPGGISNIEGITAIPETEFGGTNDADNSGVLQYIRIEFPGIPLQPNKEINGLTLGSVGSGTQIDHIQVSFSGDDSYEWFGGTVDAKYLIAYRGLDDDFDTDFGFRGRIQFGLLIRDKDMSDAAGDSNAFESDNDATGTSNTPQTAAIFSNITIIGPKGNGSIALPVGEKFEKSFRIRRNSSISVHNSITTGWKKGLSIEGSASEGNYTTNMSGSISNNILANYTPGTTIVTAAGSYYAPFFGASGNDSIMTVSQINWVNPFTALGTTPDYRLNSSSMAASGGQIVSVLEEKQVLDAMIYPNPTSGKAFVTMNAKGAGTVDMFDVTGKKVISAKISANEVVELSTSELGNGLYFLVITSGQSKETVKLIVNK